MRRKSRAFFIIIAILIFAAVLIYDINRNINFINLAEAEENVRNAIEAFGAYAPLISAIVFGIIGAIINKKFGRAILGMFVGALAYSMGSNPAAKNGEIVFYYIIRFACFVVCMTALKRPKDDDDDDYGGYVGRNHDYNDMTGDEQFIDPDGGDIDVSDM